MPKRHLVSLYTLMNGYVSVGDGVRTFLCLRGMQESYCMDLDRYSLTATLAACSLGRLRRQGNISLEDASSVVLIAEDRHIHCSLDAYHLFEVRIIAVVVHSWIYTTKIVLFSSKFLYIKVDYILREFIKFNCGFYEP